MQQTELARKLAAVDLFAGLSDAVRADIAGRAVQISHRPGAVVTEQGAEGVGFYYVTEGSADVLVGGNKVAELGPGSYFGEITLIDRQPRSATVVAGADGLRTSTVSALSFEPLLNDPAVCQALLKVLCARLRAAEAARAAD